MNKVILLDEKEISHVFGIIMANIYSGSELPFPEVDKDYLYGMYHALELLDLVTPEFESQFKYAIELDEKK